MKIQFKRSDEPYVSACININGEHVGDIIQRDFRDKKEGYEAIFTNRKYQAYWNIETKSGMKNLFSTRMKWLKEDITDHLKRYNND